MNLIVWRHAEAEDAAPGEDDMARALTARGHRQAKHVGGWLDNVLPHGARVLSSPARRAVQTVDALGRKFKLRDELAPNGAASQLIELVQWPLAKPTFVVVGHQPALGQTIARLIGLRADDCSIRKGTLWWLQHKQGRDGAPKVQVVAVMGADLI